MTAELAPSFSALSDSRAREAQLLADMLRISRLTVLYGAAGAGKTALLTSGVLPLLRRRATDRKLPPPSERRVVVPFPHCRRIDRKTGELAVLFDTWDGLPLPQLTAALAGALPSGRTPLAAPLLDLPDCLTLWGRQLGLRFLVLFDHFEQFLTASAGRPGIAEFREEFARALIDPRVPVNFLVSVREEAEPLMEEFRSSMPELGDASLRLYALDIPRLSAMKPRAESLRAAMMVTPLTDVSARRPEDAESTPAESLSQPNEGTSRPAETPEIAREDPAPLFSLATQPIATIEEPLAAAEVSAPPSQPTTTSIEEPLADVEAAEPPSQPRPAFAEAPLPVLDAPIVDAVPPRRATPRLKWLAASGAVVAAVVLIWSAQHFAAKPLPVAPVAEAPPAKSVTADAQRTADTAAAPANLPQIVLSLESSDSTDSDIARDLSRIVAPEAGVQIVARSEPPAWKDENTPALAIVRYEALDAASRLNGGNSKARERLRVVTPLYTEELHALVRRDSPLEFVHELRGMRINVGPDQSSRRLTAARLYQRMFDAQLDPSKVSTLTDAAALTHLVKDKSLDAMLVVAGQPAKWLSDLPPDLARSVKLLKFDRNHPLAQKAIEAYLPATVRATSYAKWLSEDVPTLATMAFLVTLDYTNTAAAAKIDAFLRALCHNMPLLRQQGHPKWREVELGLELETGWPYLDSARKAFEGCASR
jgi:TRAP-type uncharacterized transport system substrate-binding protein